MMINYSHADDDDKQDTFEDLITTNRLFAVALGHILKETEGIIVELLFQPDYPDDTHGKFMVYRMNGCVRASRVEPEEDNDELINGRLLWVHDRVIQ